MLKQEGFRKNGAQEFVKEYNESPVEEEIRPAPRELPKEIKSNGKYIKKEFDRTKNEPTSMQ